MKTSSKSSKSLATAAPASAVHYRIEVPDVHSHLFTVHMTVASPASTQTLRLPAWIPGSYLLREFAKHLQQLECRQGGKRIPVTQLDKATWQISCRAGLPLEVSYEVYAFDASVRTAWLDAQRGFFNGTSLCLRVHGQEKQRHTLDMARTAATTQWSVATGLQALATDSAPFADFLNRRIVQFLDVSRQAVQGQVGHSRPMGRKEGGGPGPKVKPEARPGSPRRSHCRHASAPLHSQARRRR